MRNRVIDSSTYVAKMVVVLIILTHYRFKVYIFQAKKVLHNTDYETPSDLFNTENLTSLILFPAEKKLKAETKQCIAKNLANLEIAYTFQRKLFIKKTRANDNEGHTLQ